MEQEFLIALGSSLGSAAGNRAETLALALSSLSQQGLKLRRVSRFFQTPCFPAGAGPDYINACAVLSGNLTPRDVLKVLHDVENAYGRQRKQRWGSRTLDLDLLAAGQTVLPDEATYNLWRVLPPDEQQTRAPDELILPHPRLHERAFVLVPLNDVAADWRHPVLRQNVPIFCAKLPEDDLKQVVEVR